MARTTVKQIMAQSHPDAANHKDFTPNEVAAFKQRGTHRREEERLHMQRRVIVTYTYLRMLQHLTAFGMIKPDTPITVTGMSIQLRRGTDGNEAAHQVMGELHAGGQPLYSLALSDEERRAVFFLTAATSNIDRKFNKIDILIERNGRMGYADLARHVIREGGRVTHAKLFALVIKLFVDACGASIGSLPTTTNVFHRKRKGVEPTGLQTQMDEDAIEARDILENYLARLNNYHVVANHFSPMSLTGLMNEIKSTAYQHV